MTRWIVLWSALGIVALLAGLGGAWIYSLPSVAADGTAPPIPEDEVVATLAALQPPKRQRPVIAVIGVNEGTETTDYLMSYGILRRADIADVTAVAPKAGPIEFYPALRVEAQASVAEFDARNPDGADYVIVPAMYRDDDPAVLTWLKGQAKKGAIIVGVCAGAKVVAAAGLLDNRRGTTHWYYVDELRWKHPTLHYVADRRLVVDRGVATTTGITASMPMMLTLIAAIAGRDKADSVAHDLGLGDWDAHHRSGAFRFTRSFALTAIGNTMAFWKRERLGVALASGIDEVSLALVADAWSRTYRSRALSFSGTADAVTSRNGLRLLPDEVVANWPAERRLAAIDTRPPAQALDDALAGIERRYGAPTADFVAMQLEYPQARR